MREVSVGIARGPGSGLVAGSSRQSCAIASLSAGFQDPGGPEVLARGPIHEAFAAPVVYNPTPGVVVPSRRLRRRSRSSRRPRSPRGRTSSGFPATGHGTTSGTITSGSAGSGATSRPAGSGSRATGARSTGASAGPPGSGRRWPPMASSTICPPRPSRSKSGPNTPQPGPDFLWSPGSWAWYREPLYLAARLLGPGPAGLGLGAAAATSRRRAATSTSTATGTTRWPDEGSPSPRSCSARLMSPSRLTPTPPSIVLSVGGLTANLFVRPELRPLLLRRLLRIRGAPGPGPATSPGSPISINGLGYDPLYASMAREPPARSRVGPADPDRVPVPSRASRGPARRDVRGPAGRPRTAKGPGRGCPGVGDRPLTGSREESSRSRPQARAGPTTASRRDCHVARRRSEKSSRTVRGWRPRPGSRPTSGPRSTVPNTLRSPGRRSRLAPRPSRASGADWPPCLHSIPRGIRRSARHSRASLTGSPYRVNPGPSLAAKPSRGSPHTEPRPKPEANGPHKEPKSRESEHPRP